MIRFCTFVCLMFCSILVAIAGDSMPEGTIPRLVVVSDQEAASLLSPLPPGVVLRTLIHKKFESYETINARAFAMRSANVFVYRGGHESLLAAMYREQLQVHGVTAIDLRSLVEQQKRTVGSNTTPQQFSFLANMSIQQQPTKE